MSKCCIVSFLIFSSMSLWAQEYSMSLGVFTGTTVAFTNDKGINSDPRYKGRYELKFAPIGVNFGMDYETFGFVISPGLINIGQNFYVVNTVGGQDGLRKINLKYLDVPLGVRVHIVNMSFFKFSALAAVSAAYLIDGKDVVSHSATKLTFSPNVYPILPPDYEVQYDGVKVPAVDNYVVNSKQDYKSLQIFVGAGFRSDWDVSAHWRVTFDFRVNYGLTDPRSSTYMTKLNTNSTLYDLPGTRRDMFAQLTVGVSRWIGFEKGDMERQKHLKGRKTFKPMKFPGQKVRSSKPKG